MRTDSNLEKLPIELKEIDCQHEMVARFTFDCFAPNDLEAKENHTNILGIRHITVVNATKSSPLPRQLPLAAAGSVGVGEVAVSVDVGEGELPMGVAEGPSTMLPPPHEQQAMSAETLFTA